MTNDSAPLNSVCAFWDFLDLDANILHKISVTWTAIYSQTLSKQVLQFCWWCHGWLFLLLTRQEVSRRMCKCVPFVGQPVVTYFFSKTCVLVTCVVFIISFVFLKVSACIELSMLHGWPGNIAEISDTSQTCNNPNISLFQLLLKQVLQRIRMVTLGF